MWPTGAPTRVVDLGCGTGVLGLAARSRWPDTTVLFTDSSYLSVATVLAAGADPGQCLVDDAGRDLPPGADLVLCNPPFHAGRARTRAVAARMFANAARALSEHGALWVVSNRHLDYHRGLRRWFDAVTVRSGDPRFTVIEARRPRPPAKR